MNLIKSKTAAWILLVIIIVDLVFTVKAGSSWWGYLDVFFAFMTVFMQLMALYLGHVSAEVKRKLQVCAVVFGCLTIAALLGEWIAG